jgi:hypothetical protein
MRNGTLCRQMVMPTGNRMIQALQAKAGGGPGEHLGGAGGPALILGDDGGGDDQVPGAGGLVVAHPSLFWWQEQVHGAWQYLHTAGIFAPSTPVSAWHTWCRWSRPGSVACRQAVDR